MREFPDGSSTIKRKASMIVGMGSVILSMGLGLIMDVRPQVLGIRALIAFVVGWLLGYFSLSMIGQCVQKPNKVPLTQTPADNTEGFSKDEE